ncbi:MAG TPA: four helix bundle protein [Dehalococcoidia bacterium]
MTVQRELQGYRALEVYQRSMDALVLVHELAATLPEFEKYDLASQLRRASKSVPANIAEGYAKRRSAKEFVSFLGNAMGSANEVQVHLEIGVRLKYFSGERTAAVGDEYDIIGRQLTQLIRSWSRG